MAASPPELPSVRCVARSLGELSADPASSFWEAVEPIELLDVVTGAVPEQRTQVRLAWDRDELRVLFHAEDTDPWATLTARDAPLYTEEVVEVFLDPVGDGVSYFEFEVNPLNAVLDLVVRRNRSGLLKDLSWRCEGFRSVVAKSADSWTAELSIPFRGLVAEVPVPGGCFRANFCRIDRPRGRERELTAWSPTGRPLFHVPERFGTVAFV